MGVTPHTLAEAWSIECKERRVNRSLPGYDDAENLFYSGAAAMLAMVTHVTHQHRADLLAFLLTVQAELKEYLEDVDA